MNHQRSFQRRICRDFLAHRDFYSTECVPFFKSVHPFTLTWISNAISPELSRLALRPEPSGASAVTVPPVAPLSRKRSPSKKGRKGTAAAASKLLVPEPPKVIDPFYSGMREAIEGNGSGVGNSVGLAALTWLHNARVRAAASKNATLVHNNYKFDVGQVVVHSTLGQLGVVADRLPVCFESNEWIDSQLGSRTDPRMSEPWYLILVARHESSRAPATLTRYGSELSHEPLNEKSSIGVHPLLPVFFTGFDVATGRYIPRTNTELMRGCFTAPSHPGDSIGNANIRNEDPKKSATVELRA